MPNQTITIIVDNKKTLIEQLVAIEADGREYAQHGCDVLVNEWGADPEHIDMETLNECAVGEYIGCLTRGKDLPPVGEYVRHLLSVRSDYGLAKFGLTREQYESTEATDRTGE